MVTVRSLESVHSLRYFRFCNVLHIWTIRAIPTYRVYRLYDYVFIFSVLGMSSMFHIMLYSTVSCGVRGFISLFCSHDT